VTLYKDYEVGRSKWPVVKELMTRETERVSEKRRQSQALDTGSGNGGEWLGNCQVISLRFNDDVDD
jgi:hypothetical protein